MFNPITINLSEALSFNKACHAGDTVSLSSLSSTLRKLCSSVSRAIHHALLLGGDTEAVSLLLCSAASHNRENTSLQKDNLKCVYSLCSSISVKELLCVGSTGEDIT